jgi:hypothetical protein
MTETDTRAEAESDKDRATQIGEALRGVLARRLNAGPRTAALKYALGPAFDPERLYCGGCLEPERPVLHELLWIQVLAVDKGLLAEPCLQTLCTNCGDLRHWAVAALAPQFIHQLPAVPTAAACIHGPHCNEC